MVVDIWERSGAELAERIRARRDKHLVVISQRTDSGLLHLDAEYVGAELDGLADVVVVRGEGKTWELSDVLPEGWSVYGNSARAYPAEMSLGSGNPTRYVVANRKTELKSAADALIEIVERLPLPPSVRKQVEAERPLGPTVRSGTVAGFLGGGQRALVEFADGTRGTVRQEDVLPGVRLDWVLAAGQQIRGRFDTDSRVLVIDPGAEVPRLTQAYDFGSLVLVLVESATSDSAGLTLLPGTTINVPLGDISSNPLDQADELLTPGDVVIARLRKEVGVPKLSLIDIDDDEMPVQAPVLVQGGTPWLKLGRNLLPPSSNELAEQAEDAEAQQGIGKVPLATESAQPAPRPALKQVQQQLEAARAEARLLRGAADRQGAAEQEIAVLLAEVSQLQHELRDRAAQVEKLRGDSRRTINRLMDTQQRMRAAERKLSRLQDRSAQFATQEELFRHELYLAWVERVSGAEKSALRLKDFAVGPKFLASFYGHSEEHQRKALKALVDLLVGRAARMQARQLHQLRTGDGGDDAPVIRSADDAKCWRMSVEVNAPAARRLHYWDLPGGGIELHELVPHDVTTI
ncbi:hypothetical protein AAIH25_15655 [Arthrobacter crystallopoietes]|uniref:hypothetical protein n=1 Tax=Micrococcaceae TaxID=1268 RepID=UPI0021C8E4EA|nr:hypothetical protein [Arthrobacter sp. Marseille-P9274]